MQGGSEHMSKQEQAEMPFRVLIIGGTGQVEAAVGRALAAESFLR